MRYTWKETGNGRMDHLGKQLQKTVRNWNENRINTRWTYIKANERFLRYTAISGKLQKISNLQDKHLTSYARHLQELGRSDKYIKNELSAVRFLHNTIEGARYELSDGTQHNRELDLGSTPDIKNVERAWSERELQAMKEQAAADGRPGYMPLLETIRATGMRVNEAVTLRDSHLRDALKNREISLTNTKGGRPRTIPLTARAEKVLQEQLTKTGRGQYAFVPQGQKIHEYKNQLEKWVGEARVGIQDADRHTSGHNVPAGGRGALTIHGLRHGYAVERVDALRGMGCSREVACREVAQELGHSRAEITEVYLAGQSG